MSSTVEQILNHFRALANPADLVGMARFGIATDRALNARAIAVAEAILQTGDKTARWIANDALRELRGDKVQERLKR